MIKKGLLSILILLLSATAFAQTTYYYKDEYLTKEVAEKKAKYKKVISSDTNGIENQKVYLISGNKLVLESSYRLGAPYGLWSTYNTYGTIISQRNFNEIVYYSPEELAASKKAAQAKDTTNFVLPIYPNGSEAMYKFLATTLRYPVEALRAGKSGTVYLQFIVDEKGKARPVGILKGADGFLDYEAWKLIEKMPLWTPATKDGQPVEAVMNMPFKFNIR